MPSYARAGGYGVLSSGLGDIMRMLMANRADEEDRELQELRRRDAQRMGSAAELAQPDVIPLAQAISPQDMGGMGIDVTPESLRSIADTNVYSAQPSFVPPEPRIVDVPGGEPLTVQEQGASMTPFGNVRDPGIMRALAGAEAQELENARTAERSRLTDMARALGYSETEAPAVIEGVPLPRTGTEGPSGRGPAPTFNRALDMLNQQHAELDDYGDIIGYKRGWTAQSIYRVATEMAQGGPMPVRAPDLRSAGQYPGMFAGPAEGDAIEPPGQWGASAPTTDSRRPVSQSEYDRAVRDLGESRARQYYVVR